MSPSDTSASFPPSRRTRTTGPPSVGSPSASTSLAVTPLASGLLAVALASGWLVFSLASGWPVFSLASGSRTPSRTPRIAV